MDCVGIMRMLRRVAELDYQFFEPLPHLRSRVEGMADRLVVSFGGADEVATPKNVTRS